MKIFKQVIIPVLVFLLIIGGVFFLIKKNKVTQVQKINNSQEKVDKVVYEEKEIKNRNPLKEINFDTKEINPDDYVTFDDFLKRVKIGTGMDINLSKEDFVIQNITGSGTFRVFRFRQDFIKNDPVFKTRQAKNEAILDTFEAYKNKSIFRTGDSEKLGSKISFGEELRHTSTNMINSIFTKETNMYDLMKDFEKRPRLSIYDSELLAYLYDFNGDYTKAGEYRKKTCTLFPQTCNKDISVIFKGNVVDQDNKPLKNVNIELLNTGEKTVTDNDGNYELKFSYYPFGHVRTKAFLTGYSDGYISSSINSYYVAKSYLEINNNFTLNKANKIETVSKNDTTDKYYVFKTEQSTYKVPKDGLYYMNGKKYEGNKLSVYLYEFNKWSKIDNLMQVDTFTPVYGYVGNIMKTFGMPYIQFFDDNSNEVFVKKSNPMILTNQIYHMKELYNNYDKIYEPLTKDDMKKLVSVSKEKGGYPIDMKYLTDNNMLRWPAWWVLDRAKGTWQNIGCKVLNEDGLVELPFYSINDDK